MFLCGNMSLSSSFDKNHCMCMNACTQLCVHVIALECVYVCMYRLSVCYHCVSSGDGGLHFFSPFDSHRIDSLSPASALCLSDTN